MHSGFITHIYLTNGFLNYTNSISSAPVLYPVPHISCLEVLFILIDLGRLNDEEVPFLSPIQAMKGNFL